MDKTKTDLTGNRWDTAQEWDYGHEKHPIHKWENVHRYDQKPPAKRILYGAPKMSHPHDDDDLSLTDKGTYIVEWASLMRDIAALFLEGVGLVILGHFVSIVAIMMLAGIVLGAFGLHVRVKHVKRR